MKTIILQILVLLIFTISISAQSEVNEPELIDEFRQVTLEDMFARSDYLAIQIENPPNSTALVRIYGGDKRYFASSYVYGSLIRAMWNTRKHPVEKLSIQFCNINNEPLSIKFFKVADNTEIETCEENSTIPKETVLFNKIYFSSPIFKLSSLESGGLDVVGAAEGEYSRFAQNVLKKMLNDSPDSKIYLIAYLKADFKTDEEGKIISTKPRKLDKKRFAATMLQNARAELIKNGFSPSQIVTVEGGYINSVARELEFWFIPKNGETPKPKPDYFPKKKRVKT